jgi:hypothetical protein
VDHHEEQLVVVIGQWMLGGEQLVEPQVRAVGQERGVDRRHLSGADASVSAGSDDVRVARETLRAAYDSVRVAYDSVRVAYDSVRVAYDSVIATHDTIILQSRNPARRDDDRRQP